MLNLTQKKVRARAGRLRGLAGKAVRANRGVLAMALALLPAALPVCAQSLPELYRSALAADPAVAGAQAQVRAAEQRVTQARAAFGPTAGLTASKSHTDLTDYNAQPRDRGFHTHQVTVQATQPLVRPALLAGLDQALAQLEQAQAMLHQAQLDSTQHLVEAYFEVLKARDALALVQAQRAATAEQLVSAQRSFKVGTVPVTDVRDAEAKADTVAAQLSAAEEDLSLKQQVLAEVAGVAALQDLLGRGLDGQQMPRLEGASLADWLADALAEGAQVRQARQALVSAQAEVQKAESQHLPTADFTLSRNLNSETGSTTTSFPRRTNGTQLGVNLNVPLFASFATQAKVREALAQRDKAQSDVDTARRTLVLGVRQTFSAALSAIGQARGLQAAEKSAAVALRANRRGYEVGMRVNSDVLEAQSRLFETRRDLSRARYDAWVNYIKLKALAGQLGEGDLSQLDGLLVAVDASGPTYQAPHAAQGTALPVVASAGGTR